MTHSLMLFGDVDFSTDRQEIEKYLRQITGYTKNYAPEYLQILKEMNEATAMLFAATLIYWQRKLAFLPFRGRFIETKIMECLSFWSGYLQAGGVFKYDEAIPSSELQGKKLLSTEVHSSSSELVAVIPIGFVSPTIASILQTTLSTLERNASIAKVLCIFDGCQPNSLNVQSFKKAKTSSTLQKHGPAHARNLGITEALEDRIDVLFLDSDITMSPESLSELLISHYKHPAAIACPKIVSDGSSWWDQYHDLCGTLNGRYFKDTINQLLFGTTSCMLVPNTILQSGVRFCEDFDFAGGEDIDFCLKAISKGFSIKPLDHVRVKHWYGYNTIDSGELENWSRFKERFSRYGKGEVMVLKRYPHYYNLLAQSKERSSSEMLFC